MSEEHAGNDSPRVTFRGAGAPGEGGVRGARLGGLLTAVALVAAAFGLTSEARADGTWQEANGSLAADAVFGGIDVDGTPLAICYVNDIGGRGVQPGKVRDQSCVYAFGGEENFAPSFWTLITNWKHPGSNEIARLGNEANGAPLGICRGAYAGGVHVGKTLVGQSGCAIPYGGQEVWLSSYEVLGTTDSFGVELQASWHLPLSAIVAGREADGTPLYACVGSIAGGMHPGKTRRDWMTCAVPYGGVEHQTTNYLGVVPVFRELDEDAQRWPLFVGGEDQDGTELGVCAARFEGTIQVGKYRFATRGCHIAFGGKEHVVTSLFRTLRK